MGTRADFYVRRKRKPLTPQDWIGSIAWDGYPEGVPDSVKKAKTETQFRTAVAEMAKDREDFTLPANGWPWPWDDSGTTDYAYVFSGRSVTWRGTSYPNMAEFRAVTLGKRSGLIVVTG